jgi:hypothetical protein
MKSEPTTTKSISKLIVNNNFIKANVLQQTSVKVESFR